MAIKFGATPAKASEGAKIPLPEPEITFDVDPENGHLTVHAKFDLNVEETQAYMSKKTKVVGETSKAVPVTFELNGEQQVLSLDGNPLTVGIRVGARIEDKKAEETAATNEANDTEGDKPEV